MKLTENISKKQTFLTDLCKLFVAYTSWRIPRCYLNHIFDCHLTGIFESIQETIQPMRNFILKI